MRLTNEEFMKKLTMMGYEVLYNPHCNYYQVYLRCVNDFGVYLTVNAIELDRPYVIENVVRKFNETIKEG